MSGADAWLRPYLLAGGHASQAAAAGAGALDASGSSHDRGAGAYLRWFGEAGWYAGADAGYAKRHAALQRPIDFGAAGRWQLRSQRAFDVASVAVEAGRRMPLAGGSLTPYLRLQAASLHAAAANEQGDSGFELRLAPASQQRLQAVAGLRVARDGQFGAHALRLHAAGGLVQPLARAGDPLRAAYSGVPDAWFELPGATQVAHGWFALGVSGSVGSGWYWDLAGARQAADTGQAWRLQLARAL
jgi:hypothetical protein